MRCGKFVVELLWACPFVVSVGGVVAGVRVVEFGPNWTAMTAIAAVNVTDIEPLQHVPVA